MAQKDKKHKGELEIKKAFEYGNNIIATLREPFLVLDNTLRIISTNEAFYATFEVTEKDTIGQRLPDLGNRQWNIPALLVLLKEIIPEKKVVKNYEVEHKFEQIGERVMLLNACQLHIPKKIAAMIMTGTIEEEEEEEEEELILLAIEDITEHKKAQEAIKESEAKFRGIVLLSQEAVIVTNAEGKIEYVNPAAERFFNRKLESFIGTDFGLPLVDGKSAEIDIFRPGKDPGVGEMLVVETEWLNKKANLITIRDITERKRAEEEIRRETDKWAKTFDSISDWIFIQDKDFTITRANKTFVDALKLKPEEIIGKKCYQLLHKMDQPWPNCPFVKTKIDKKSHLEEVDDPKIGVPLQVSISPIFDEKEELQGSVHIAKNITEHKQAEKMERAQVIAEASNRAKSEFLANMSHALRTPLNSINGFSDVLYEETFGPLNEKQKNYVNYILTSGKHLLLLINQILDMAKVESGKMKLALSSLPMKSLLNDISILMADMVSKKKIELSLEIAEDLPNIEADELKVKEILYNLLSNAINFTPEGGKIGLRAKKVDAEIAIEIWDTGIGIAPENLEKVFEGFFRIDTPYSRVTEGTGLGLPLSKKMVELHGGKFSVESGGLNKGTQVKFTLPIISKKEV
jgi:two-component system CheB/CheR fusion protein